MFSLEHNLSKSQQPMAQRLSILNHPPRILDGPQLLHHLIDWEFHGSSCAIDFTSNAKRVRYRYDEIQSHTGSLTSRIQSALTESEDPAYQSTGQHVVPVLLPQSPALYISQLAILATGGAFCPINLDAPRERIKFVVRDIAARIIITTMDLKDLVTWEGGPTVVLVDEFPTPSQERAAARVIHNVTPSDLAYVMYTSGSSGLPKGVGVSHLAASQSLLAHEKHIPQFKRFLQFAAPSFDVSVFEVFFPLIRGCTLVGCNRSRLLNDLPGTIAQLEVDAAELTPTVAGSLLQNRSNAPGLKLLLTIGEMLTRPVVEEFGGDDTKASMLYGMYGPTEAAIHCNIIPAMRASERPGNIGIPFDTVSAYIAKAAKTCEDAQNLRLLPLGEFGELVLGGPQLARGYLNREEQNKLAFVTFEGSFYYRTGDRARFLENGTIEIHGRMSSGQVKLRGQRVELGEIEDAVYRHPGIRTAVAAVLGGVLVVFALVDDDEISRDNVLSSCSRWLPKFMVPSEIILLRSFPYLPSGKVDKKQLELAYHQRRTSDVEDSEPLTETEQALKNVLQDLLGSFPNNRRLGAAGLDSLVSIRVSSRLRSMGFNISAITVLQADTLSALARSCENSEKLNEARPRESEVSKSNSNLSLGDAATNDVAFTMACTPLQASMLAETAQDKIAYRNWVELELHGVQGSRLAISAFLSLARLNPILRTGFAESQGPHGYIQVISKGFPENQIDLVHQFDYGYNKSKDSLRHPVRVQVLETDSNAKLLLHIHHALYDAWSLELLLDDLDVLLSSKAPSERPPFSALVEGYQDGTLLPNEWASKDYWRDHLAGLEKRQMPNFHSRRRLQPGLKIIQLRSSIATSSIEMAARRFSTSPQSLFQAAYALVLSSYLGSFDICFGTVFSGRTFPIPGIEDIAAPCLATLPVRIDLSSLATLGDLVQECHLATRKHLEHSALPLGDIKSVVGADPPQQLFDTLLIWQQTLHSYDHSRKHVSLVDSIDNLEYNLTLEIIPGTGNVVLKANYQQSVFPESQVHLLLCQIEQFVQAILHSEVTPISKVSTLLEREVLSIENEDPDVVPRPGTLSSPVEEIASTDPSRTAIEFARSIESGTIDAEVITYGELNVRSNQIGHKLLSAGVLPNDLICICMEKCGDLYASILAATKVGAGYLPVLPDVPLVRLQHILREAKTTTVITQLASKPLFESLRSINLICVDKLDFTKLSVENIPTRFSPEHVSYCVFTSGSTGTPKGVLVTQGNLLSNLDILQDIYPTSTESRFLQSCSQAFDVSVFEIFFTWRVGGCLCSTTNDVLFRDIENAIRLLNVTHLSLTPTVAALVDPKNVPKVRFLVTAGEAVTQKVFNTWANNGLYQGYGPSETTNICTINPEITHDDFINNIGPPFKNTSAFVVAPGPDFFIVPRGGEGEFCFGGSQVFRGYTDKNQEIGKIIEHPAYGRLYRSGDFGRMMPDGSLNFTRRKDDQVKIRGNRVELGEIDNVMLRCDEVQDCATIVFRDTADDKQRLICFWTDGDDKTAEFRCSTPDSALTTSLFRKLESNLPGYMIPSALIPVSILPPTSQGKIDKRLLSKAYRTLDSEYLNAVSQTPISSSSHSWTELESQIAGAVAEVTKLDVGEIGPNTSFFSVGVDSISAILLSRSIEQCSGLHVPISDILKNPSVVRLAERMAYPGQLSKLPRVPLDGYDFGFDRSFIDSTIKIFERVGKYVQQILPCTPLQEAMLSAAESSSGKLYSNEVIFNIKCDVARLEACWREIVQRHEILRTCFVSTDNPRYPYAQVILKDFNNLSFSTAEATEATEANTGNLEPPYTTNIVRSKQRRDLVISMHHALYDGTALAILCEEVERLYLQQPLPPPVSIAPFLEHIGSINIERADRFWEKSLRNCVPTLFQPVNRIYGVEKAGPISRLQRVKLEGLGWVGSNVKKHSTSLLSVCHTAWAALLSTNLQQADVVFGSVVSGRTIPVDGIERLVAPCFNTIPIRLPNVHKMSYLEALRELQTANADAFPFQLTSLRRIQSRFSPGGSRLFDSLFILQNPPRDLDPAIWELREDNGSMDFPIVCEAVPRHPEDVLEIILHSHTDVISEVAALALLNCFVDTLRQLLETPRRQILSNLTKAAIHSKIEAHDEEWRKRRRVSDSQGLHEEMSTEEKVMCSVISRFTDFPIQKIGRDTSIFRLGLDSISTVQVATQLRRLGYNVTAGDILENPSIAKLSQYTSQPNKIVGGEAHFDFAAFDREYRGYVCARTELFSENIQAVRPCTAVQKGMLAQTLHSNGKEYINSIWFDLSRDVDLRNLKDNWREACNFHEMLRTGFVQTDDSLHPFLMVTYTKDFFQLPWLDGYEAQASNAHPGSQNLLHPPWSLRLVENGAKRIMKFTAHHSLYDAQSMQMILEDISRLYNSRALDTRPGIASLLGAILLDTEKDQEAKQDFWQRHENKIIVNHFPSLTPVHVSNAMTQVLESVVSQSNSDLEKSCRILGVTMQAATQATWARILAAYTGEMSTTFGMALSGRSINEDASAIAFPSIVTLPVRCDVFGTNAELLQRTMNSNALLHRHQFTPLTLVQKWAGYPEGKIFDTLFAYQKIADSGDEIEVPWKIAREEASVDYAVSLEVQPANSGTLTLRLTFKDDLIPVAHAELLLKQYEALLLNTLQHPEDRCDQMPKIGDDLLSVTPAKHSILPGPVTLLHEFVERGAQEWPDRIALEFATNLQVGNFHSTTWTYKEINQEGNKIASLLLERRIVSGQLVAICFEKSAEASFAIIGILKAGCAYVALDPNAPTDRLKFIIQDSGVSLIVTAGTPAKNIQKTLDYEVIDLNSPDILINTSSEQPVLGRAVLPQDISYCLYTSGTTGTPKGCLITHENAVQALFSFQRLFADHWTTESKWLQFASFHFDVSVLEQFWSWSVGICVASAPRDVIFEDITGAIQQLRITHIDLTPSLARLLHPDDALTLCNGVFITGGEQLKQEILDVWGERGCIYNGYGPTEATIGCTMYPRVPRSGKPSNIGPQFQNVGSFVLKQGTSLPVLRGGVGELCISGKLVGKGYLNRPELTTEKFPFLEAFNERVYRTGDLVRILHNGDFLFLGRADDQVKLRGQRLELTEINEVIKKGVDGMQEVVTLVLKHAAQEKEQLVTFFVSLQPSSDKSRISKMRDACKARLPGYMVPTHFITIQGLPLNANNKADTKQLAAIYNGFDIDDLQKLGQSPRLEKGWNNREQHIVDIIANLLQIEASAITHSSNIFELGLDSISIISFSRALQNAGLESAKLSAIKSNPSLDDLVSCLLNGAPSDKKLENTSVVASQDIAAFSQRHIMGISKELGIDGHDIECIAPCTPVQEGMIYRFLESHSNVYFNDFNFHLAADTDIEALQRVWGTAVSKLQILRTKFVATDDGYAQVVIRAGEDMQENDEPAGSAGNKIVALQHPFKINIKGDRMNLRIFHGLYDGNSLTMLLQCIFKEYESIEPIEYGPSYHSVLPHGPLGQVAGAERFWRNHLKDWTASTMLASSRSAGDTVASKHISRLLDFEALRKQLGVSHQSILQAAWLSVLQHYITAAPTIGLVTSGRSIDFEGADKVIGPMFNTVPFHMKVEDGISAADLIRKCHNFNMQMQDYQHTPLKDIQRWSPAKRAEGLFDTLFVFQREVVDGGYAEGIWDVVKNEQTADYPLAFEATLSPNSQNLDLIIVAQGSIVSQTQADDLLDKVQTLLQNILETAGRNVIRTSTRVSKGSKEFISKQEPASAIPSSRGTFSWTREARQVRTEIASLAGVAENIVHEGSSIFELGLDSIDVIKLSSRLKKHGIEIPVSIIIKSQTVSKISASTVNKSCLPVTSPLTSIEEISNGLRSYLEAAGKVSRGIEAVLPATPLQQGMVNEMLRSAHKRYFNVEVFELDADVNLVRLKTAVRVVVEKSPILRTTFIEVEDPKYTFSYAQIIHAHDSEYASSIITTHDLPDGHGFDAFMVTLKTKAINSARKDNQLLQIYFISTTTNHHMVMAISHALYDGRSLRMLHADFSRAYQGAFTRRPDSNPFLEQVFQSTTDEAKNFWRTMLSNLPTSRFPRKTNKSEPYTTHRLQKRSRVPVREIEALCRLLRITLQTLGQTCWALVLSHLMGQLDVIFGSVLLCRDSDEADNVMFPLMNTVPVRSVIHGRSSELLKHMQDMSNSIRQYQHFPLGKAQSYGLASRRDRFQSHETTIFDTLFIYQGRRDIPDDKPLYRSVSGTSEVEFPVCVEMEIVSDQVIWTTACKSIVRSAEETQQIIESLDLVLGSLVSRPNAQTIQSDSDGISVCGLPKYIYIQAQSRPAENETILSPEKEDSWTVTEVSLRKALHELSNMPEDTIKRNSTIFNLGLDSISALKLPALLRARGIHLTHTEILKAQTISAIARASRSSKANQPGVIDVDAVLKASTSNIEIRPYVSILEQNAGRIQEILPVTAGQLFMIRQWQVSRGVLFYPTFTYLLPSRINKALLERAWRQLLSKHDILRTGFVEVGKKFVQVVFKSPQNDVIYRLQGSAPIRRHDLSFPPVNLLMEEGESNAELKLVIHHALYDGISLPMLIGELEMLYRGQVIERPGFAFRDFVALSNRGSTMLSSPTSIRERWVSYLKTEVLHDVKIVEIDNNRVEVFQASRNISNLRQQAQVAGVSIDALLLAGISKLRAKQILQQSGDVQISQVIMGIYLANRALFGRDLSLLAAPTLNIVPLLAKEPLRKSLAELAQEVQRDLLMISGSELSSASLEEIYDWTGVRVDFFVNILKNFNPQTGKETEKIFVPKGVTAKSKVVHEQLDEKVLAASDERCGAFLPSIDVEIRYQEDLIEMGVFAPVGMLIVEEAERMIGEFVGIFT